jgi:hypothetical protein
MVHILNIEIVNQGILKSLRVTRVVLVGVLHILLS